eukprot:TRINITY_DN5346_c0_g1_i1.p1 TRINITY_DN5346_c0_g1~~TRINITY_DN5346_c0_g1_i1.p1  ORF type:complete len:207 (-),score=45.08 TRINITY_DN5346_c0_g1_i1:244-840(-)
MGAERYRFLRLKPNAFPEAYSDEYTQLCQAWKTAIFDWYRDLPQSKQEHITIREYGLDETRFMAVFHHHSSLADNAARTIVFPRLLSRDLKWRDFRIGWEEDMDGNGDPLSEIADRLINIAQQNKCIQLFQVDEQDSFDPDSLGNIYRDDENINREPLEYVTRAPSNRVSFSLHSEELDQCYDDWPDSIRSRFTHTED